MVDVHGVNLFEGPVLGLDDEEVDNRGERGTASGKDETIEVVNLIDDEPGEKGNEEVPEPVGSGCEAHAGSAVSEREELCIDGPCERTPAHSKGSDGQA